MNSTTKVCNECGGRGEYLTKGDGKCSACNGTGINVGAAVLGGYEGDCEKCGGTGICPTCHGSGIISVRDEATEVD